MTLSRFPASGHCALPLLRPLTRRVCAGSLSHLITASRQTENSRLAASQPRQAHGVSLNAGRAFAGVVQEPVRLVLALGIPAQVFWLRTFAAGLLLSCFSSFERFPLW